MDQENLNVLLQSPYPASTKQAAGFVDGILTDVLALSFTDKIFITITQHGRLAQWVQVPLEHSDLNRTEHYVAPSGVHNQDDGGPGDSDAGLLLPSTRLAAQNLLGASSPEREAMGQLYATQIANAIITKNPEESRTVMVGLGLTSQGEASREQFFDLMEIIMNCL